MKNEEFLEKFNERLAKVVESSTKVEKAMNYSLSSGGKRLRPLLIKLSSEDMSVNVDLIWHPALAVELFHTASLIHDDLPQIDDSPLRRGKPSCHMVYGNDFAILAGDGLMLKAFEVLSLSNVSPVQKAVLFEVFSRATYDVLIGESLDVEYTGRSEELGKVLRMYAKKTGALFAFCLACGAILSGRFDLIDRLSKLGTVLGIWFQIVDDLKDLLADEKQTGKSVGRDKILGKPTVVSIMGVQKAQIFADNLLRGVINRLDELQMKKLTGFLGTFAH
ncbi:MAG: polyprenyl synthetase family protein [Pseudothermotoga sp.]